MAAKNQALQEVPKTQTTDLQVKAAAISAQTEVVASDVIVPRLLLMQGISPLVTSRKAQIGDIIRSTTGEKVGDPETPVDLIPLRMDNTWTNFEDVGQGQPQFRGQEIRGNVRNSVGEVIGNNEGAPWEYTGPKGEKMTRKKTITLFGLLPKDVAAYQAELDRAITSGEAPDLTKTLLPVVLTFQSTSFKYAGKKCASFFNDVRTNAVALAGKMTIAPFQYVLRLVCREEKKGTNAWYVYDFDKVPTSLKDAKVREVAAHWTKALAAGVQVDDAQEVDESHGLGRGSNHAESEV